MITTHITIDGKTYPSRPTMGAMVRYKRETGNEVTEMRPENVSDMCAYLWCCVASASNADGVEFNMSFIDFADRVSQDDMQRWATALQNTETQDDTTEGKKKTPKQ